MVHFYFQNSGKSCLSVWSYRHPDFFIFEPENHCKQKKFFLGTECILKSSLYYYNSGEQLNIEQPSKMSCQAWVFFPQLYLLTVANSPKSFIIYIRWNKNCPHRYVFPLNSSFPGNQLCLGNEECQAEKNIKKFPVQLMVERMIE